AAILGWALMGEALTLQNIAGILLAVSGIMLVIRGDVPAGKKVPGWQGILWAALATLGQAGGVILSKLGLASLNAVPAAQIRLIGGVLGMALILTVMKRWVSLPPIMRSKNGRQAITVSIVLGTLIGMVLSMLSIKLIPVAIASILFSLMPVIILPISVFILKEKVNPRETLGALVTVGGVSLLFL
ncbi:MAG: DMT family transporter, partial [Eubacteriales bacterium]|nr:DMT family transporter [Eubacteriales bacterium]